MVRNWNVNRSKSLGGTSWTYRSILYVFKSSSEIWLNVADLPRDLWVLIREALSTQVSHLIIDYDLMGLIINMDENMILLPDCSQEYFMTSALGASKSSLTKKWQVCSSDT